MFKPLVKDGELIYPENKKHFERPIFIVHDVLQNSGFGDSQRLLFSKHECLFELFKESMELLKDEKVRLLVVADGINYGDGIYVDWTNLLKEHPEWELECHGLYHEWYDRKDDESVLHDLTLAKKKIEDEFGVEVHDFYPPRRKCNENVIELARKAGLGTMWVSGDYNRIGKCMRVPFFYSSIDFHYWHPNDMIEVKKILSYLDVAEPIIIVGAPRSGTTALMRYLNNNINDSIALKEKEKIWSDTDSKLIDFYSRVLAKSKSKVLIEKNVRNSFRIKILNKVFPYSTFIHIIRDGRASAASWKRWAIKTGKEDQSIEHAAQQWVDYVRAVLRYKPMLEKKGNYIEVRYEDLCDNLDYFESKNFKWETYLTEEEKKIVEKIQGPLLKELGYI